MTILNAKFAGSAPSVDKCPASTIHEYAFIGRSNVGKSSLINTLLNHKGLAKTSATPGKTMLINRYEVNNGAWALVDLPGYGYACRSRESREQLRRMIVDYVQGRPQMTCLFVLIDSRHEPQKVDLEFLRMLGAWGVPFALVFTKMDKNGPRAGADKVGKYCSMLLKEWEELPPTFATSAVDSRGRDELLNYIQELNQLPVQTSFDE